MFEEECRGLDYEDQRLQSEARLCVGRDRPACVSAHGEAPCRHGAAGKVEGTGVRAALVRMSPPTYPVEARRLGGELEETVPALPRRRVNRSQTGRTQARSGHQDAHDNPAGAEPEMVARLHVRCA